MLAFLNSFLAWGLLTAAIPILIHLFTRKKLKTVAFSSIRFLQLMQKEKIRQIRLRQWLLLLLRTLVIALLVMAFMRPTLKRSAFIAGQRARTTLVIILDNSLSMALTVQGKSEFALAKRRAAEIVDLMQPGDELYLITASKPAARITEEPLFDAESAQQRLASVAQTEAGTDLRAALELALGLLGDSRSVNKEIYLLSDRRDQLAIAGNGVAQPAAVRLFYLDWPAQKVHNLTLSDLALRHQIFQKNKVVEVSVSVANAGGYAEKGRMVSLYLNDQRVAQEQIDVPVGQSRSVLLRATPSTSGYQLLRAELENDDVVEDNYRYGLFYIPDSIKVLLMSPNPRDRFYLNLALQPAGLPSQIRVEALASQRAKTVSLEGYDAVLLANVPSVDADLERSLKSYVEGGGGLLLFMGDDVNLKAYNQGIFQDWQLGLLGERLGDAASGESVLGLGQIKFNHPVFEGVFAATRADDHRIDSPAFTYAVMARPDPSTETIMEFSNHAPFLLEKKLGSGRVMVFLSAVDGSWSDLPQKGIFAPLIDRAVRYVGTRAAAPSQAMQTGSVAQIVRPGENWQGVRLERPDGEIEQLRPKVEGNKYHITVKNTQLAGFYRLRTPEEIAYIWAVNFDAEEMQRAPLSQEIFQTYFKEKEIVPLPADQSVDAALTRFRLGTELWQIFLAAALFLLLVEMLLYRAPANDNKGERAFA